jgi:uncharacterized membrane protein YeaQ/YmgE (transglycosylase-associated protein family)
MGFVAWIIMGLIAAAVAKSIMDVQGSWLFTLLVGVGGAIVGGWIGDLLGGQGQLSFFSLVSWALAILGSVIVLWVWGKLSARRARA